MKKTSKGLIVLVLLVCLSAVSSIVSAQTNSNSSSISKGFTDEEQVKVKKYIKNYFQSNTIILKILYLQNWRQKLMI